MDRAHLTQPPDDYLAASLKKSKYEFAFGGQDEPFSADVGEGEGGGGGGGVHDNMEGKWRGNWLGVGYVDSLCICARNSMFAWHVCLSLCGCLCVL